MFWKRTLSPQEYDMMRTKYALDGEPVPSDESLAAQYGLSGNIIAGIRKRALHCLRTDSLMAQYEMIVAHTAREVLSKVSQ